MRITSYMVSFGYAAFRQRVGERGGKRERGKHIPGTVSFKEAEVVCIIKSCSGCKLHLITGLSGRERERRGKDTDRRRKTERSRAIEGDRKIRRAIPGYVSINCAKQSKIKASFI